MQYTLCSSCGYPIKVDYAGQKIRCPFCGTRGIVAEKEVKVLNRIQNDGIAQEGVALPTWLVAGTVGLIIGVIFGPVLLASSREGAQKLARIAEEKLKQR
jgi:DNA-directed RNA polymerase subunit RPC12/RpoP